MKNSEILKEILKTMEQEHINLYHSISKQEIEDYISSLTNLDELNEMAFDCEMLKLFAMFKDAHTKYYIPRGFLDKKLFFVENKVFLKVDDEYKEVVSIGNMKIEDVLKHISNMQSYETKEYLCDCLNLEINNQYYYEMLGLAQENGTLTCVVNNNGKKENISIKKISRDEYNKLGFIDNSPFYRYEILKNNILLIKYRKCLEHQEYPFTKFVEEIKQQIKSKNITQYILDLRDNHGGNSSIINPLTQTIKELGLNGVLLIDNGVFSSGRWAVADFKREFNTTLIGEPTGGAAASYGYNKNLKVEDKKFSVSLRYWDFSNIFGYKGSIQPDIFVPKTIKDLRENKDSQLLTAVNYLSKTQEHTMV